MGFNRRKPANAHAVLADDRRRHRRPVLVPMGAQSGLPYHERDRPANARPSPRRGRDQPHTRTLVPLVPAERTVCRSRAAVSDEYRRTHRRCPAQRAQQAQYVPRDLGDLQRQDALYDAMDHRSEHMLRTRTKIARAVVLIGIRTAMMVLAFAEWLAYVVAPWLKPPEPTR